MATTKVTVSVTDTQAFKALKRSLASTRGVVTKLKAERDDYAASADHFASENRKLRHHIGNLEAKLSHAESNYLRVQAKNHELKVERARLQKELRERRRPLIRLPRLRRPKRKPKKVTYKFDSLQLKPIVYSNPLGVFGPPTSTAMADANLVIKSAFNKQ